MWSLNWQVTLYLCSLKIMLRIISYLGIWQQSLEELVTGLVITYLKLCVDCTNQIRDTKFTKPTPKVSKSTDNIWYLNHLSAGRPQELQRRDADDAGGGGRGGAAEGAQVQRAAVPAPEAGARLAPLEGDSGMMWTKVILKFWLQSLVVCQTLVKELLYTVGASPHSRCYVEHFWHVSSGRSPCFVKHFWHVPLAGGLILQLSSSPNGNCNFREKTK